jgi:hypothetical protein
LPFPYSTLRHQLSTECFVIVFSAMSIFLEKDMCALQIKILWLSFFLYACMVIACHVEFKPMNYFVSFFLSSFFEFQLFWKHFAQYMRGMSWEVSNILKRIQGCILLRSLLILGLSQLCITNYLSSIFFFSAIQVCSICY